MKVHINPEYVTFVEVTSQRGKSKPQIKVGFVDGSYVGMTAVSDDEAEREAVRIMTLVTETPIVINSR